MTAGELGAYNRLGAAEFSEVVVMIDTLAVVALALR